MEIRKRKSAEGQHLEVDQDYLKDRERRTLIRDQESEWIRITSGAPQGTVLAPVMFLIFINDMVEPVDGCASLIAHGAKVMRRVEEAEDAKGCKRTLINFMNGVKNL